MFASVYARGLSTLAFLMTLAGCAGQQVGPGPVPQGAGRVPFHLSTISIQRGFHANRGGSWIVPEAKSQSLLYVTDSVSHVVDAYTYPRLKYAGQLTGFAFPMGACGDKAGNVWIADAGGGAMYEYAHGGTSPINTITNGMYQPQGCAIDPKTGDLAVANGNVEVVVFHNGSPTEYRDFNFAQTMFLSYDNHDNLFVDGTDKSTFFHYAELPAGGEAFTDITLNGFPIMQGAGDVQWDGAYITIGDTQWTLYQTQGSNVVSTTTLSATCVFAFFIVPKKAVIAPDQCSSNLVSVYPYPAGGAPIKEITSGLNTPYAAVLSR